jgi:branched-chain amino acid transport system substrate-binding protein
MVECLPDLDRGGSERRFSGRRHDTRGDTSVRLSRRIVALTTGLALVGAACGSSSTSESGGATTAATTAEATTAAPTTAAGGGATTAGATTTAAAGGTAQKFAAEIAAVEAAAKAKPLKATGDPIVVGFQNPEGDPAGTFPEYTIAAEAAVKYINEELGGVGADHKAGKPGRPIKLEVCKMAITPADSQKCANEIAAKKPTIVFSSLNFFGNHFAIYKAANIPVVVGTPITALDFTSPGVYATGGGGGCLGTHTGLVEFVTKDLGKKRIAVPWADTPPGVFCYHDLEKKPLEVLAGKKLTGADIKADGNAAKGSIAGLEHIGVAVKPGQADVTPQATQVLDFKPDGIIYSAQGADCWTFVNSLAKLGWKAETTPLVLSGACIDLAKMKELGDVTKGIYFVGASNITNPEALSGQLKDEAVTYLAEMEQYAENGTEVRLKGFATQGFTGLMQLWSVMQFGVGGDPAKIDGPAVQKAYAETAGFHQWGSTGLDCAGGAANAPYIAVCSAVNTATQWDGTNLKPIRSNYSGLYLIKGTELDFGK